MLFITILINNHFTILFYIDKRYNILYIFRFCYFFSLFALLPFKNIIVQFH